MVNRGTTKMGEEHAQSVQRLNDEQGLEALRAEYAEFQVEVLKLRAELEIERYYSEQEKASLVEITARGLSANHDESVQLALKDDLAQALEKVEDQLRRKLTGSRKSTSQEQASFEISNNHRPQDGASSSKIGSNSNNTQANAGSVDFQKITHDLKRGVKNVTNQIKVKCILADILVSLAKSKAQSQDSIPRLNKKMSLVESAFFEQKGRLFDVHGSLKSFTPAQLDNVRNELVQALDKVEEQLRIHSTGSREDKFQQQQTGNLLPGKDGESTVIEELDASSTFNSDLEMLVEMDRALEELRGCTEEALVDEIEALVEKLDEIALDLLHWIQSHT